MSDRLDYSKHAAVGAFFRKEYIKTGIFDVRLSDIISDAFDIRSDSDYNDYFVVSKSEVEEQIENARYDTETIIFLCSFLCDILRYKGQMLSWIVTHQSSPHDPAY